MWTDSHCHLPTEHAVELLGAAQQAGVNTLVTVGCTVQGSIEAIALAERLDGVWATAGVHPHDATGGIDGLAEVAVSSPRVVAWVSAASTTTTCIRRQRFNVRSSPSRSPSPNASVWPW